MQRRRARRLLTMALTSAVLTSGMAASPTAAQLTRSGSSRAEQPAAETRTDDLDALARELQTLGWEFAGDARTGLIPRDAEAMVVLADHRAFRQADPPDERQSIDPPEDGSAEARQSVAPTEPGEPQDVIQGTDNRVRITSNLDKYPLRTVGTLTAASGPNAGATSCTGTLVGPRHVLTAAHCLFAQTGFFTPLFFNPGQAGTTDTNGAPRPVVATLARNYFLSDAYDYGVAILADSAATASLSWMAMSWLSQPSDYVGRAVENYGYPAANQQCAASPSGTCDGFMYAHACLIASATDGLLKHWCDTTPGHSGGPLFATVGTSRLLFGIHMSGLLGGLPNTAVRLRPALYLDACGCAIPRRLRVDEAVPKRLRQDAVPVTAQFAGGVCVHGSSAFDRRHRPALGRS